MHNFLTKLFGKKEPEVFTISMGAVPAWLNGREKTARSTLLLETGETQKKIRDAVLKLQQITNTVAQAEQDPAIHPKLKSIAKNSLPQFVKAMNASLAKELPDEVEEFYPTVVECLKNCLNSTRGQGRYLQAVFPDEMKAVKSGIDVIGHEINDITASLARYRKEKNLTNSALALHTALLDISEDIQKAEEKDKRIALRITEMTDRIATIEKELAAFPADERIVEVNTLKAALQEAENRRDTAIRINAALSMTASHVFRKAEKIAVRQKHPSEISILRHTMELLSDHMVPDTRDLAAALAAACPVAERMITAEEILLKNKEERSIFSDTKQFSTDICASFTDLGLREEACRIAEDKLTSHPLLVKVHSLEREKAQLETMLKKEDQARVELKDWIQKTQEKIPKLSEELTKKIEGMVGGGVQLQIDDQRLA
jgi:predicted  nucleic acid-binding Zn-ribbon protein